VNISSFKSILSFYLRGDFDLDIFFLFFIVGDTALTGSKRGGIIAFG